MPGERSEDAIAAAARLKTIGITTILTHLGENLERVEDAEDVFQHYLRLFDLIQQSGLDAHVSIKTTQLGYDQDVALCARHLDALLDRAVAINTYLWLDMESSPYVDGTIDLYRRLRARASCVGIALQACLYRTEKDLDSLLPLGAAIRLVKGAYLEPASVAFPRKADVDANYFTLASRLLMPEPAPAGSLAHIATHDIPLQDRIRALINDRGIPTSRHEVAMLYGIGSGRQAELANSGVRTRCLISYGDHWFPWYMRRLAERPANVWFVVKNAFGG